MNDRDSQNLNFFNALIVFSLVTLFWRLFMAVWQRSKLGAILLITVGPYLLVALHSVESDLQYRVLCQIKPEQVACKRS
jgi:hypothetical protein